MAMGGGSILATTAAEIRTEAVAEAALYALSPAFVAVIEQFPAETADKVLPETEQIDVVVELKVTAPVPDPPVVEREAVPPTVSAETGLIDSVD
jgi:hypothetical protein